LIELLIVVAIILIIAAIAIPNLLRSKDGRQMRRAAVAALRTINTSSVAYSTSYGAYPGALASLGPMSGTSPDSTTADLIDSVLAGGIKSGYNITYTPGAGHTRRIVHDCSRGPVTLGVSGQRGFFTDQSGVIRADPAGSANRKQHPAQLGKL